jgi:hypothetical protein
MQTVTTIGLDIAKSVFQVHGNDAEGKVIIRRKLKRRYVLAFFEKLPPCLVGIEACATSRRALWPAVMRTALTGRTHGCTDQGCTREESHCQPGAVHTWHLADNNPIADAYLFSGEKRTSPQCSADAFMSTRSNTRRPASIRALQFYAPLCEPNWCQSFPVCRFAFPV